MAPWGWLCPSGHGFIPGCPPAPETVPHRPRLVKRAGKATPCPEPSPLMSRKSSAITGGPLSMGLAEPLKTRPARRLLLVPCCTQQPGRLSPGCGVGFPSCSLVPCADAGSTGMGSSASQMDLRCCWGFPASPTTASGNGFLRNTPLGYGETRETESTHGCHRTSPLPGVPQRGHGYQCWVSAGEEQRVLHLGWL